MKGKGFTTEEKIRILRGADPSGPRLDLGLHRRCHDPRGVLRTLTIVDEFTRECQVRRADRALRSEDVLEWLQKAIQAHSAPESLRSDNGAEFIAHPAQRWLAEPRIRTIYIEPGNPWQNGFVESFHGRFRGECLNREQL